MTHAEREIEDVTDYFADRYRSVPDIKVVNAERQGHNVLVLIDHLNGSGAMLAGDRNPRRWEVLYRWLRHETADLAEVLGEEVTWWKSREINSNKSLFAQLNCF